MDIPLLELRVCTSTTCNAQGSLALLRGIQEHLREEGLEGTVRAVGCGCLGGCSYGPNMNAAPSSRIFFAMDLEKTKRLLRRLGLTGVEGTIPKLH